MALQRNQITPRIAPGIIRPGNLKEGLVLQLPKAAGEKGEDFLYEEEKFAPSVIRFLDDNSPIDIKLDAEDKKKDEFPSREIQELPRTKDIREDTYIPTKFLETEPKHGVPSQMKDRVPIAKKQ